MWRHLQRQGDRERRSGEETHNQSLKRRREILGQEHRSRGAGTRFQICVPTGVCGGGPDKSLPLSEPQFYSLLKWCWAMISEVPSRFDVSPNSKLDLE